MRCAPPETVEQYSHANARRLIRSDQLHAADRTKHDIRCDEREPLEHALSREQAVKWIFVLPLELAGGDRVPACDRKFRATETAPVVRVGQEYRCGIRKLADTVFSCDLPRRRGGNEDFIRESLPPNSSTSNP